MKQEPEEENEINFDPNLDQEPSQDFDQRQQTEWTIKQEPEDENEIRFDPDLYQEPPQDFDQRQQTERTIKEEPKDENDIKCDPDFHQEPSQDFDQKQQTEWTIKKVERKQGKCYEHSSSEGVIFIFFFFEKLDILDLSDNLHSFLYSETNL